jgi:sugar phosphate isomerase/epimerase
MPQNLSFQLFSARNHQPWDQIIAMLAKAGYTDVEGFGGAYGSPGAFYDEPEKFRALLDKHGLRMSSGHFFPIEMFEKEKKRVLHIARTLRMHDLYCPYIMPDQRKNSPAFWKSFGKRLGAVNSWMRDEGLGFGWHNHDFEFVKLKDGSLPIERIFEGGPFLDWEADIAWIVRGKQNPLKWIKTYRDRITSVHVKDIAEKGKNLDQDGWCNVGEGTVNWPEIFKALKGARVKHYVMEHDNPKDVNSFAQKSVSFCKKY